MVGSCRGKWTSGSLLDPFGGLTVGHCSAGLIKEHHTHRVRKTNWCDVLVGGWGPFIKHVVSYYMRSWE